MREFITVERQKLNPLTFRIKAKQFQWELTPTWQGYQETPCVSAVESLSVVRYTKGCNQTGPVLYLSFISPSRLILPHWTQGSSALAFTEAGILPLVNALRSHIFSKENDTQQYLLYIIMHIQSLDSVW